MVTVNTMNTRVMEMGKKKKLSKETEVVKVVLELPKQLADFIKESWDTEDLQETLTKDIVQMCHSQIEGYANEQETTPEELIKKYDLMPIFKQYNVLPCYLKEAEAK